MATARRALLDEPPLELLSGVRQYLLHRLVKLQRSFKAYDRPGFLELNASF